MQTLSPSETAPVTAPHESLCCTHHHPPLTPAGFYRNRRLFLGFLGALFLFLAIAAAVGSSRLLLTWDEPVQRFVEDSRTPALDSFFLGVSRLGSTIPVIVIGTAAVLITWHRCRAVALAIAFSMLARPLTEFLLKELVGRDRPELVRLVHGTGPSFPSGHVMATIALWGLLPLVVGLFTRRRTAWWASVVVAGTIIVLVAASRVYLGVHWLSDVTGGIVLGSFFLLVVEAVLLVAHRKTGCGRDGSAVRAAPPPRVNV